MNDNFKKHIEQHYKQQSLAPEIKQRLLDMQSIQVSVSERESDAWLKRIKSSLAMPRQLAAIAIIFVLVMIPVLLLKNSDQGQQQLLSNIAAEVVLNHNKRLPSDYVTDSYAELSTMMDKLDFSLSKPAHSALAEYQLTGARYCSLQGQIAGQLKLESSDGEQHTLYVTRLSEEFSGLQESVQEVDGLTVRNWQSGGLFFSLAR